MRTPRLLVLTAACLALGLQACGSDDDSDSGSKTASKADFVSDLDALCKEANAKVKKIGEEATALQKQANGSTGAAQQKAIVALGNKVEEANVISRPAVAKMRKLDPPPSEQKFFDDLVNAVSDQQDAFDQFAVALQKNDLVKIRELNPKLTEVAGRRKGLISGHGGFKYCQGTSSAAG